MEIKINCGSCDGKGLYRGFAEPPGVAVVCLTCKGSGYTTINPQEHGKHVLCVPFSGRKPVKGVHTVRRSRGTTIVLGCGPAGPGITYQEFCEGKLP